MQELKKISEITTLLQACEQKHHIEQSLHNTFERYHHSNPFINTPADSILANVITHHKKIFELVGFINFMITTIETDIAIPSLSDTKYLTMLEFINMGKWLSPHFSQFTEIIKMQPKGNKNIDKFAAEFTDFVTCLLQTKNETIKKAFDTITVPTLHKERYAERFEFIKRLFNKSDMPDLLKIDTTNIDAIVSFTKRKYISNIEDFKNKMKSHNDLFEQSSAFLMTYINSLWERPMTENDIDFIISSIKHILKNREEYYANAMSVFFLVQACSTYSISYIDYIEQNLFFDENNIFHRRTKISLSSSLEQLTSLMEEVIFKRSPERSEISDVLFTVEESDLAAITLAESAVADPDVVSYHLDSENDLANVLEKVESLRKILEEKSDPENTALTKHVNTLTDMFEKYHIADKMKFAFSSNYFSSNSYQRIKLCTEFSKILSYLDNSQHESQYQEISRLSKIVDFSFRSNNEKHNELFKKIVTIDYGLNRFNYGNVEDESKDLITLELNIKDVMSSLDKKYCFPSLHEKTKVTCRLSLMISALEKILMENSDPKITERRKNYLLQFTNLKKDIESMQPINMLESTDITNFISKMHSGIRIFNSSLYLISTDLNSSKLLSKIKKLVNYEVYHDSDIEFVTDKNIKKIKMVILNMTNDIKKSLTYEEKINKNKKICHKHDVNRVKKIELCKKLDVQLSNILKELKLLQNIMIEIISLEDILKIKHFYRLNLYQQIDVQMQELLKILRLLKVELLVDTDDLDIDSVKQNVLGLLSEQRVIKIIKNKLDSM